MVTLTGDGSATAKTAAPTVLVLAVSAAVVITAILRLTLGRDFPLWLDETWTGAISSSPDLRTFVHELLNDVNAPLYYVLSWGWVRLFGLSDPALRSLAAVFGLLAPVAALRLKAPLETRLTWCAIIACWMPGIYLSQEARGYTLLLFLNVLSAAAFASLLRAPTRRRAAIWTALSCAAVMTHYFSAFVALAQGLIYLSTQPRAALRSWPAGLLVLPVVAWMAIHAPHLARFARADVAWYPPLTLNTALNQAAGWVFGAPVAIVLICAILAGCVLKSRPGPSADRALMLAFLASLAALVAMLAFGMARPSFAPRYLTPCVPGLLLGVAQSCTDPRRTWREAPAVLVLVSLAAVVWSASASRQSPGKAYNFEAASAWIAEARPASLLFIWDHPAARVEDPASAAKVGGFFLNRAGLPFTARTVAVGSASDPNAVLASDQRPRSAQLWVYNLADPGVAARRFPPRPVAGEDCRDFGRGTVGIFACRPALTAPIPPEPASPRQGVY